MPTLTGCRATACGLRALANYAHALEVFPEFFQKSTEEPNRGRKSSILMPLNHLLLLINSKLLAPYAWDRLKSTLREWVSDYPVCTLSKLLWKAQQWIAPRDKTEIYWPSKRNTCKAKANVASARFLPVRVTFPEKLKRGSHIFQPHWFVSWTQDDQIKFCATPWSFKLSCHLRKT